MRMGIVACLFGALLCAGCATGKAPPPISSRLRVQVEIAPGPDWARPHTFFLVPTTLNPQFALWLADDEGQSLGTLFVTGKAGKSAWTGIAARPEALPLWFHASGARARGSGLATTRDGGEAAVDANTGATPEAGFSTVLPLPESVPRGRLRLRFEVNAAFDGFDGSANGFPSVFYEAVLDPGTGGGEGGWAELTPVGTGSPDGSDGYVHPLALAGGALGQVASARARILE
jgi:hypothetical protein